MHRVEFYFFLKFFLGIHTRRRVLQNSSDMSITRYTTLRFRRWRNWSKHLHSWILSSPTHVGCRIRLRLLQSTASAALNVTLFHEGSNPNPNGRTLGKEVTTSGPYHDNISGVDTPLITINPGKYLLVPSTFHPATEAGFSLIFYYSKADVVVTLRQPNKY